MGLVAMFWRLRLAGLVVCPSWEGCWGGGAKGDAELPYGDGSLIYRGGRRDGFETVDFWGE
jgi:hypothetical protein